MFRDNAINNFQKTYSKDNAPSFNFSSPVFDSASVATGGAFLTSELEKLDPRILEPLHSETYARDMDYLEGGGFVDYTSNFFVDYATTAKDEDTIIGTNTTDIAVAQTNITKDIYKVADFGMSLKYSHIDMMKSNQVGRDLQTLLDGSIRLNWNKMLDKNTYIGITKLGVAGLVNNSAVSSALAGATGTGSSTNWAAKTGQQILDDVDTAINAIYAASGYDPSALPNHILVPPSVYSYLVRPMVVGSGSGSVGVATSILEYIENNNIAKKHGVDLKIFDCRWCIGAGASSTDRMVVYRREEDRIRADLTVPLHRVMTQFAPQQMSYITPYVAQFGQVKFLYPTTVTYVDGI